ncbi:MAG: amidohydrolase family protein [Deltaproteobacteria bacterium]|jgi:predicted TIM-barrel fold metal-dependent hydrolase|nr:amidohydrolase family protein [Deltaproteobacteria bacterium]
MARQGLRILDSDMHVLEPVDLWQRHIDPAFRDRAPVGLGDQQITLEGRDLIGVDVKSKPAYFEAERRDRVYGDHAKLEWSPEAQLLGMEKEGIDLAVLFPTRALFTHSVDGIDPRFADAIGRAFDDWLFGFCQHAPDRLRGVGHVSPHDMDLAVAQTRRCVEELGFVGIFLRSQIANERNWYDAFYDPLWAECERLGVPVCFHGAANPPGTSEIAKVGSHFEGLMLTNTVAHSMPAMLATIAFTAGGILERFPGLRVAFLEGNCSWVPWLFWRLDEKYEWLGGIDASDLSMPPSEYFKRQCFVSTDCDEAPAKYLVDAGYEDTVVFSTDYPHNDSKFPHAVDEFLAMDLPEAVSRKWLWDNCARLYGLDESSD